MPFEDTADHDDTIHQRLFMGVNDNRIVDIETDADISDASKIPNRILYWAAAWFDSQDPARMPIFYNEISVMEKGYVLQTIEELAPAFQDWPEQTTPDRKRATSYYALQVIAVDSKFVFRFVKDDEGYTITHPMR